MIVYICTKYIAMTPQTLAQIIQHFTSGMVEEFIMYRLIKTDVLPKIEG